MSSYLFSFFFFFFFFFFNDTATSEIYTTEDTLSLHDAFPISPINPGSSPLVCWAMNSSERSRGSARSEEHTSELQSPSVISYPVCCLKKKKSSPLIPSTPTTPRHYTIRLSKTTI